ncbi:putative transposase [Noviherbaspirillum humi]|uniref:Putative transposase n=1 Tax=Noviherbaspirillum humi TaxID=1688639 RepID=A0A239JFC4_9BURK|nr:transposase [Noviherbaspirillum humi]SNT04118.1 putative transposase [Noviherbaspirillum humi]
MARLPRLVIPNEVHYVVLDALDHQPVFREQEDYQAYLRWLKEAGRLFQVAVHGYVLLPDQVHLLVTPAAAESLGRMMQWLGRQYVPYFNARYKRAGTLWQGRFRATVVEAATYLQACTHYLESLPVRNGLVAEAANYEWSSHAHHIGARTDPVITDHRLTWALGNTPFERERAYRDAYEQALSEQDVVSLSRNLRQGWPLGSIAFRNRLEKETARRVAPAKRGRPAKRNPISA